MARRDNGGGGSTPSGYAGSYNQRAVSSFKARDKAVQKNSYPGSYNQRAVASFKARDAAVGAPRTSAPSARSGAIARRVAPQQAQAANANRAQAVAANRVPAAPVAQPPKPPAPPSIEQFLRGDTAYMGQEAGLKAGMDQYNTDYGQRQAQYGTEYNMNKDNLAKALTEANTGMTNDYASRGMLNSGTYGTAYADQQTEYNSRQSALDNARNQWLAEQLSGQTTATSESALSGQKARQDAINRRAAQYAV